MLARQLSRDKEIFCTTDTPLTEVFNAMITLKCACLPVVESPNHRNIIGTITEHDICLKIIGGELNPRRLTAGRVMNGNFTTVRGETDTEECLELMRLTETERLFVVDDNGAFLGVLVEDDLKPALITVTVEPVIAELTPAPAIQTKAELAF